MGANYLVLVGPMVDLSLAPSHRVEIRNLQTHSTSPTPPRVSQMGVGDTYYTDEQYKFRNIPSFLHSLNGIKTVNVPDRYASGTDTEFICFDVVRRAYSLSGLRACVPLT